MTSRFRYASIMRQTSEGPNHDQDEVVGFHGKSPEVELSKEFDEDSSMGVVGVRYERLELIKFDRRVSGEEIHQWFVENDPMEKWCDGDGMYDPDEGLSPGVETTVNHQTASR